MDTKWTGFIEGLARGVGGLPAAYQRGQQISETSKRRKGLREYQEGMETLATNYALRAADAKRTGMPISDKELEEVIRQEKLLETNVRQPVNMFYENRDRYDPVRGFKGEIWERIDKKTGKVVGSQVMSYRTPRPVEGFHWRVAKTQVRREGQAITAEAKKTTSRKTDTIVYKHISEKSFNEQKRYLPILEGMAKRYGGKVKITDRYKLFGIGAGDTYYIEVNGKKMDFEDLKKSKTTTKKPWE